MNGDQNPVDLPFDETNRVGEQEEQFDFAEHRRTAVEEYLRVRPRYEAFARAAREIVNQALRSAGITVNSVEARAKDPESFGAKSATRSDDDPEAPKYPRPLQDITDLAGVRIITFFPRDVATIGACIQKEFEVLEHIDLSQTLIQQERFGYQSEHFLVQLSGARTALPEYEPHRDLIAEIQVRTILQHAWAEIEHDIQYKSTITIPYTIRRRFMALAGMLEIADREFQEIQYEDEQIKKQARILVEGGEFKQVEITADALRSYLDRRIGPDTYADDVLYERMAQLVRRLRFTTIDQVDACIKGYDGDQLSRIVRRRRQDPLSQLEDMLLAGMGPVFIDRRTNMPRMKEHLNRILGRYQENGISIGQYDPQADFNGESSD